MILRSIYGVDRPLMVDFCLPPRTASTQSCRSLSLQSCARFILGLARIICALRAVNGADLFSCHCAGTLPWLLGDSTKYNYNIIASKGN